MGGDSLPPLGKAVSATLVGGVILPRLLTCDCWFAVMPCIQITDKHRVRGGCPRSALAATGDAS
jgi:hypothetical protein